MPNAVFDPSRLGCGPALIGVAFWIFLAVIVLGAIWSAFARNREMQKTIRLAIEKGMQLDPALIDNLVARKRAMPEGLQIGGIICIAIGVGLPILGYFVAQIQPIALFPIVGAGILVGLIGVSLVICSILVRRRENARKNGNGRT